MSKHKSPRRATLCTGLTLMSNFIHHRVIEKKQTNKKRYTINTNIQSVR